MDPRRLPLKERVYHYIDVRGPDECWLWKGTRKHDYGRVMIDGKYHYAHRVVLSLKLGRPLLDSEDALHSCDNPPCCNPSHLRPGTHKENMADMAKRSRSPRGEENHNAKLTEAQAREMRSLYQTGEFSTRALAKRFGIGKTVAHRIVNGQMWSHA